MNQPAAVDRIRITRSVSYAVKGAPEVPAHGAAIPGTTLAPNQVTFTYRAAPDSQLGRIQARVKGFWKRDGARVNPGQPMAQHYFGDLADWPEWLAEEARLHDPEVAVPVPEPADRAAEIERLREEHATWRKLGKRNLQRAHEENARLRADHQAALERIREAVCRLAAHAVGFQDVLDDSDRGPWAKTVGADIAELRRLAAEAQPTTKPETTHRGDVLREAEAEAERQLATVQRVRHILEMEPVLNRTALEYRGLIISALMADEAQQPETEPAAGARQDGAQQ